MQMNFLARHDLANEFKEFSVKEGLWRTWAKMWYPPGMLLAKADEDDVNPRNLEIAGAHKDALPSKYTIECI